MIISKRKSFDLLEKDTKSFMESSKCVIAAVRDMEREGLRLEAKVDKLKNKLINDWTIILHKNPELIFDMVSNLYFYGHSCYSHYFISFLNQWQKEYGSDKLKSDKKVTSSFKSLLTYNNNKILLDIINIYINSLDIKLLDKSPLKITEFRYLKSLEKFFKFKNSFHRRNKSVESIKHVSKIPNGFRAGYGFTQKKALSYGLIKNIIRKYDQFPKNTFMEINNWGKIDKKVFGMTTQLSFESSKQDKKVGSFPPSTEDLFQRNFLEAETVELSPINHLFVFEKEIVVRTNHFTKTFSFELIRNLVEYATRFDYLGFGCLTNSNPDNPYFGICFKEENDKRRIIGLMCLSS